MDNSILVDGVIDGRKAARVIRARVSQEVADLRLQGIHPRVAFVRVGEDAASETYVRAKARACGWVGVRSEHIHLPADTSPEELTATIERLNADDDLDALLVQLPLPDSIGGRQVLNLVDLNKDVDGFHPANLGAMIAGCGPLEPCTPAGVMRLIEMLDLDLRGKRALVVGRSVIVGRPMYNMLVRAHATVLCAHRHTPELADLVAQADVVVVATGVNGLIRGDWVKPGSYLFDVGITRQADGTLCGDVCFDEVIGRAAGVTPVPGGIGPMTIAQLLHNTLTCAKLRRGLIERTIRRG
jgi:methylenetetrahydrofolate dehydrogenase (NADP+)/methenyltetrahydrofolate cyclohydrolase